ncbi:MAG: YceI family protein [Flavisolibacter sp.]|jgi:polyisoprenoid-binding protein YceI|nr:YceI family protein [Flavisolibacter sp.]
MINKISSLLFMLFLVLQAESQEKFYTKTGKIIFFSEAALEDIKGSNRTAAVVLDPKTGALDFSVLIKGFEFEKAVMQEHFNTNYVESDKFPKATFEGNIVNNLAVLYGRDGSYSGIVRGKLTLHGVTRDVETTGTIKITGSIIETSARFHLLLTEFGIKIPSAVKNKISNKILVRVECRMEGVE